MTDKNPLSGLLTKSHNTGNGCSSSPKFYSQVRNKVKWDHHKTSRKLCTPCRISSRNSSYKTPLGLCETTAFRATNKTLTPVVCLFHSWESIKRGHSSSQSL